MSDEGDDDLLGEWQASVSADHRQDEKALPVARGAFRVHLGKLLRAVGLTLKAAKLAAASTAVGGWALATTEGLAALAALRQAIFDKLSPIEYLALVMVSTRPEGMTREEVEETATFYTTTLEPRILPSHLWIDADFLAKCSDSLAEGKKAIDNVLESLMKRGHVRKEQDRYLQSERVIRWTMGE